MSLEAAAPSPQPSAPPAPQPTPSAPAAEPAAKAPSEAPEAKPSAPSQAQADADWRAARAGGDAKKLEALSRYATEADWTNSWFEQREALSKRAAPVTLAPNASPEQVAEYRKAIGLPEIAKDAKPDAYIDAYKISAPDGYTPSATETGLIAEFAKRSYEAGHSPKAVQDATSFFFQEQAAAEQALRKISTERQKEWTNSLRDKLGSKEFDAQAAATEAWVKSEFADDPQGMAELLNTQMPGGGRLGDHPWMFEQFAKLAMGNGFTDRIEANALESSGKSLMQQRDDLMALRRTNKSAYDDPKTQAQIDKLNSLLLSRGEIDQQGRRIERRRA